LCAAKSDQLGKAHAIAAGLAAYPPITYLHLYQCNKHHRNELSYYLKGSLAMGTSVDDLAPCGCVVSNLAYNPTRPDVVSMCSSDY
jgi:hypothetical protein